VKALRARRKICLQVFFFILSGLGQAIAQPTQAEISAFFAKQRKDRADFARSILAETDSSTAAALEFDQQAQADRAAFITSLQSPPAQDDLQRLADFNAAELQKKRDFQASLPTLPKSKLEQAIADFDKSAVDDKNALNAQLSTTDPNVQSAAIQQFQNTFQQKRAQLNQLKSDTLNDIARRRRQLQQDQAKQLSDFLAS
jgi:hypothetical protein